VHLSRRVIVQLCIFAVVSLVAATIMIFGYMKLPNQLFDAGHYKVYLQLPEAAGLYASGNVTYRGTEVGRVESVGLSDTGVLAVLSLKSDVDIPADLDAEVHSQSAIGEQYVALLPRTAIGPALHDGSVIPADRTAVPPDINSLLDATNRGLQAIPNGNLKTVIDEAYTAVGGLGPELHRLVKGSTTLAIDARANLDPLTTLVDQSQPVLQSQMDTAQSIQGWAAHLKTITGELQRQDGAVQGVLQKAPAAADEIRKLFDRLQPTLPVLLSNLVTAGNVAVTYQPNLEQLLVLIPAGVAALQGIEVANHDTKQAYKGLYLDFNLNLNLPPVCSTGFLPAQQQRATALVDAPPPPAGDLYCRVPQDSQIDPRGARNYPCETVPGKRAPTVKMCESDKNYVPLNDGNAWKGDPNATLSGQAVPQPRDPALSAQSPGTGPDLPAASPAPPPIAIAQYDPQTGTYVGPDGHVYTQSDLAQNAPKEHTWQSMLTPPAGN
jgi:phospholipid/cholesterol/gamma-HCH transport system substrate-binding protein